MVIKAPRKEESESGESCEADRVEGERVAANPTIVRDTMAQMTPPLGDPVRPRNNHKQAANSAKSTKDAVPKRNPHDSRFGQAAASVEQLDTRPLALRIKTAPWWRFW